MHALEMSSPKYFWSSFQIIFVVVVGVFIVWLVGWLVFLFLFNYSNQNRGSDSKPTEHFVILSVDFMGLLDL